MGSFKLTISFDPPPMKKKSDLLCRGERESSEEEI